MSPPVLKRVVTLPLLSFYGIGTILGAGIYVLVGKVAAVSSGFTVTAFMVAFVIALLVGLCYSELASRFPESAGEATYVLNAFNSNLISSFIGWSIIATGIVSMGVLARGFMGYFSIFFPVDIHVGVFVVIFLIMLIAIWGIMQSVGFAMVVTLIEIAGVLLIIWVSTDKISQLDFQQLQFIPEFEWPIWKAIFLGAFIAFYAYIGFEDIVNIAEEVIEPERNIPKAILIAIGVTTLLYLVTALAALSSLSLEELSGHQAPFVEIVKRNSQIPVSVITVIGLIAIINGALVQLIMGSRVLYGLAEKKMAPAVFKRINAKTQTPVLATITIAIITLLVAWTLPMLTLAKLTSSLILIVFSVISVSLWVIKRRKDPHAGFTVPAFIPVISLVFCLSLLGIQWLS